MEDGINRRLYMGNEFDNRGINYEKGIICERKDICGTDKIRIIDGTSGEKITRFEDKNTNLALPKMEFAKRVLQQETPFDTFCFDSFVELFTIIDEILKMPLEL